MFANALSPVNIFLRCSEARSYRTTTLAPPISSSYLVIDQALPSCSYSIEVHSGRSRAACRIRTDSGQVSIEASAVRLSNGTVQLTWQIPPEIRDSDLLTVEINWGEGWILITPNAHVPLHFEPKEQYDVQLRFRHADWMSVVDVVIPAAPNTDKDLSSSRTEVALVYSVTFGSIAVGCAILVAIILLLKYIQWSRRDSDKVTDFREKSKEEFERMSLKRSSVKSTKSNTSTAV